MNNSIFEIDDYKTELIFSLLRWIFLVVAVFFFYYPPIASILNYSLYTVNYLVVVAFVYMSITQLVLYYMAENKRVFGLIMKTGIVFDYIAINWLLLLSGGAQSPFIPITYLLVMHATIYWHIPGTIISYISMAISYTVIFLLDFETVTPIEIINFNDYSASSE
jgi:diguanylate cyclase